VLRITTGQLEAWVALYLWPFIRIGGCLMVAPVFGAAFIPARSRLILAGAITLLVAPLLPATNIAPFSGPGFVVAAQQLLIGLAMGFVVQIVFDALSMAGQLLANSMGLSFAFNVDPLRGTGTPVIGQFYSIFVTLTFLALNGHLTLLETLVDGFRTLPVGTTGIGPAGAMQIVTWGGRIFSGALLVSLPGVTALLIVNLAFGVVSRAAPSLNLFAIGFPVTLVCGLVVVMLGLPSVQHSFIDLMKDGFLLLTQLLGKGG
jgi:flagellar biosynthetic protein FliR